MKHFFTIILILVVNILIAQNISELDKKNGFKSYTLGTKKSEIIKRFDIECLNTKNPNTVEKFNYANGCKVLNNADKKVFSQTIEEINLKFNESNRLENINIHLAPMTTSDLNEVYTNFKKLFGKYTTFDYTTSLIKDASIKIEHKPINASEIFLTWKGEKVKLNILSYHIRNGIWITTMNIWLN